MEHGTVTVNDESMAVVTCDKGYYPTLPYASCSEASEISCRLLSTSFNNMPSRLHTRAKQCSAVTMVKHHIITSKILGIFSTESYLLHTHKHKDNF